MTSKIFSENDRMDFLMGQVMKLKEKPRNLSRLIKFNGLVNVIKNATGEHPKTAGYIQEVDSRPRLRESDPGKSAIAVHKIVVGDTPIGALGVRSYTVNLSNAPHELYVDPSIVIPFDGVIYRGQIPGHTPKGKETILVANQFDDLSRKIMQDPYFRVDKIRSMIADAEKTKNWDELIKMKFGDNNCKGKPLFRQDKEDIDFVTYELDSHERERYFAQIDKE